MRIIAHELGHGIFKLEHPFKKDKSQVGKTTSIMDYGSGTDFLFPEWKQIGDPKLKIYAFQGQEEGEYSDEALIYKIIEQIRCNYVNKENNLTYLRSYFDRVSKYEGIITIKRKKHHICIKYNPDSKNIRIPETIEVKNGIFEVNSWYTEKDFYPTKYKIQYIFEGFSIYSSEDILKYLTPSKNSLKNDFENNYKINIKDGINTEEFSLLKKIAPCTSSYLSLDERFLIIKKLSEKDILEGTEDLILDILDTCPTNEQEQFLEKLSNDFKVFTDLYNKMDNKTLLYGNENNKTRFIEILYVFWLNSKYKNTKEFTYTTNENPVNIDYKDKSELIRGLTIPELSFQFNSAN